MAYKELLFVGGGHAHLYSLLRASEFASHGCKVTLVSPQRFQYYSGMGPGMLGGSYLPSQARLDLEAICESSGVTFIDDLVTFVDPLKKKLRLVDGNEIRYDIASFNTGSRVADDFIPGSGKYTLPVKPIANLLKVRELATSSKLNSIIIIGGGPAGVEIAGNLRRATGPGPKIVLLEAGIRILGQMSEKTSELAHLSLRKNGVDVVTNFKTVEAHEGSVVGENGSIYEGDLILLATGTIPSPLFKRSGLTFENDPGLPVDHTLRHQLHPELFGTGDCAYHPQNPIPRVGVYAVRQAPILFENIKATLVGEPLTRFSPQKRFLLILNMGDDTGILEWGPFVIKGKWAWKFKRSLDTSFLERFQPPTR